MDYITKTTPCVKFRPFNLANPNPNHVTIYPGTECKSELGMRGGNQAIVFNRKCFLKGLTTPVHELMHTLGFVHEHNRTLVLVWSLVIGVTFVAFLSLYECVVET